MRILQLAPPWFPVPPPRYGGTELVVAGLTDRLVAQGHDVTLVASGGSTSRARLRTVYDTPPSTELGDPLVELPHVLTGYLEHGRYDLIHDHTVLGIGIGAVLDHPAVVHTVHGAWTPALTRLYERVADRVSLVAISHDQAARAPAGLPLAGVVHNGIDLARYPFSAVSRGHLAWLGRAGPDKGADLAVRVARQLSRPLRMAMKLNEPDEHRWWEEVFAPLRAGGDVEVIHNATHAEKLDILCGAEALLFPIRWDEPFGLAMVEANACGTPVAVFERGAAPEVIEDQRTGWVLPPGDVDAMCAAVEGAAHLDRARCRRHVERRFSAERMARGYARIYHRVTTHRTVRIPDLRPTRHR